MAGIHARAITILAVATTIACAHPPARTPVRTATPAPSSRQFVATAYCQTGKTASGAFVRTGMVAADPAVLPLGSTLRILEPRAIAGTFTVADTGAAIRGARLDIFMPDCRRAIRFGRQHVVVRILRVGNGEWRNPEHPNPENLEP